MLCVNCMKLLSYVNFNDPSSVALGTRSHTLYPTSSNGALAAWTRFDKSDMELRGFGF